MQYLHCECSVNNVQCTVFKRLDFSDETRNVNKKYDKEKPSEKIRTFYCSFYENDCNLYAYLKKKFYSQFSKVMSVSYEQGLPSIVPRA